MFRELSDLFDAQHNNGLGRHLYGDDILLQFGIFEGLGDNRLGVLEVIVVIHLLRSENLTAHGLGLIASQLE